MEYTQQDIQDNMGLVFMVARRMDRITGVNNVMEFQDLISEGVLGLIYSLDRFEPERGHRFSSYAVQCIKYHMLLGHERLFKEQWKAKRAGVRSTTIPFYRENSIEPIVGASDHGMGSAATFESLNRRHLWDRLQMYLTPRQKDVINLTLCGMTQTEIAECLGVTRQAVHITYNNAVENAKKCFQQQAA